MHRLLLLLVALLALPLALDASRQHGPKATEVRVELGTPSGEMRFTPDRLSFQRGTYYKLVIHNPSPLPHYFSSDALGTHVFTRKVEVEGADGKTLAEIHGAVYQMEVAPGQTVSWFFYPMTKGGDLPFICLKEGHAEAGMVGRIEITDAD